MYSRHYKGLKSKLKSIEYFIDNGYEVFDAISEYSYCDLVLIKNDICYRVSVKSTSQLSRGKNNYIVELRNVSRRNNGKICVTKFQSNRYDLVVVYIIPENRIQLIESKDIKVGQNILWISANLKSKQQKGK